MHELVVCAEQQNDFIQNQADNVIGDMVAMALQALAHTVEFEWANAKVAEEGICGCKGIDYVCHFFAGFGNDAMAMVSLTNLASFNSLKTTGAFSCERSIDVRRRPMGKYELIKIINLDIIHSVLV